MIYYGKDAVAKVEEQEGKLTFVQAFIVQHEGYSTGAYDDTKGIVTSGVGQTGKYRDMSFKDVFALMQKEICDLILCYPVLDVRVKAVLMSAMYRGDLQQSPRFRELFNSGRLIEASEEFLDHKEYKDPTTPSGIKKRLQEVSDTIKEVYREGK